MRRLSFIALLALAASVTAAPPPQPLGQLSVTTTPKGASIAVDGTKYGNAPATIPNLSTGDHLVVVTLADYEEARRKRLGVAADTPHRLVHRKLLR